MSTPNAASVYDSAAYKRSRGAYCAQCAFEYFISILVADAYLAKLLSHLGLSDSIIGIISSFISLAFLFQLISVFTVQHMKNTKLFGTLFNSLSSLFFLSLYLVPFIPLSQGGRTVTVVALILLAYFCNYYVTAMVFKWGNSFVDPHKRASYAAGKEMISLLSGVLFTLFVGHVLDRFEAAGNIEGGFIFTAAAILIVSLCNFISFLLIEKEHQTESDTRPAPLGEVLRNTLGNKNYRSTVWLSIIRYAAHYMLLGFMGTYKTKELLLSVGAVQIINLLGNLSRFAISRPFGRFSDKHSFARGIELAFILEAAAYVFALFTAPGKTWWMIIPYTILYRMSLAGSNQNLINLTYNFVDSKYFVQATAIKNSVSGLVGFLTSLVASAILAAIQENGNQLFGLPIYGQQVLAVISLVLIVIAILYTRLVIEKQEAVVR